MKDIVAFILAFSGTAIAVIFSDRKYLRRLFVVGLVGCVLVAGFSGITAWPFFSWHLYTDSFSTERTYYDLRVVGGDGQVVPYDARAVDPAIATPVDRHAERLATTDSEGLRTELGCYLLGEAQEYLQRGKKSPLGRLLGFAAFPKHQYGYLWTDTDRNRLDRISAIGVYRVRMQFPADGVGVTDRSETRVTTISEPQCS